MNSSGMLSTDPEKFKGRLQEMERDLQFLYFLLNASIYKKQSPNLYERLRQYSSEAGAFEVELRQLDSTDSKGLEDMEKRMQEWKRGLYEFLESML
jgi:hypothetical protein